MTVASKTSCARAAYKEALTLYRRAGDVLGEAVSARQLGALEGQQSQ